MSIKAEKIEPIFKLVKNQDGFEVLILDKEAYQRRMTRILEEKKKGKVELPSVKDLEKAYTPHENKK